MLKIYTINYDYIKYLRQYDSCVPMEHDNCHKRPYIGIVLAINNCKYFAPMSSPKTKHKRIKGNDFYKIADGKYGVINFNNMIPVVDNSFS